MGRCCVDGHRGALGCLVDGSHASSSCPQPDLSPSAVYAVATFALFVGARLWMDVAGVPAALLLGYGATVVENFIRAQREKQRLSRYFSPAVVAEIVRQTEDANLASARRRMTVLFSDIRGFTSMSEKMTPEDVVTFLREYFTVMTD